MEIVLRGTARQEPYPVPGWRSAPDRAVRRRSW